MDIRTVSEWDRNGDTLLVGEDADGYALCEVYPALVALPPAFIARDMLVGGCEDWQGDFFADVSGYSRKVVNYYGRNDRERFVRDHRRGE